MNNFEANKCIVEFEAVAWLLLAETQLPNKVLFVSMAHQAVELLQK